MYSVSPLIESAAGDAKKTTAGAMSCGWPIRPWGVSAYLLAKIALGDAGRLGAFGFNHVWGDGVHPDFAWAKLFGNQLTAPEISA